MSRACESRTPTSMIRAISTDRGEFRFRVEDTVPSAPNAGQPSGNVSPRQGSTTASEERTVGRRREQGILTLGSRLDHAGDCVGERRALGGRTRAFVEELPESRLSKAVITTWLQPPCAVFGPAASTCEACGSICAGTR